MVAGGLPYPRYRLQLLEYVCRLLPAEGECAVLDVGAGDGHIASVLARFRPRTRVIAVETFLRPGRSDSSPFVRFDGLRLPFADASFDVALLLNVLHHAARPGALLREVLRVTRSRIVLKDHLARGWMDRAKLAVLDVAGNLGSGAVITGRYQSQSEWDRALGTLPGTEVTWHRGLSFRTGLLELLFPNDLEVMMQVDRLR